MTGPMTSTEIRRRRIRRAARRHQRRRRLASLSILPTICTLGNLVAGFAAIHYAAKPPGVQGLPWEWTGLTLAGFLVFTGILLDGIDGSLARLTRSHSAFGAQLDSIADMVCFGVAPAFMALRLVINHLEAVEPGWWLIGPEADSVYGKVIWGIAAAFVCGAALRLARFNVESGLDNVNEQRFFCGLPSPGAAGTVASLIILHQHYFVTKFGADAPREFVQWSSLVIPIIMLLCALGMVSSIPYAHVTNAFLRGPKSFAFIARFAIIAAIAIWWLQEALAIAFVLYAISGPGYVIWKRLRRGGSRG